MAHFARVEDNIVREVIVVNNEVILDENNAEQESIGAQFCQDTFGGSWVQTSYNANFRGKYAELGDIYDPELNIFTTPIVEETVTE